jgi:hypothetical protein
MSFDYRVIRRKDGLYVIGEVYYDDNNDIIYWDSEPLEIYADGFLALKEEVKYIKQAFKQPILLELDEKKLIEI